MAGITSEHAEAQLALWLAADAAVSSNQSYTIDTGGSKRTVTRADALEIRNNIDYWDNWCRRLDSSRLGIQAIGVITR
ncbi:DUF6148 family protein [Syntrophotalea acetylenica]|uniref:Uncharacterized protein n=1 Tax=Syntrophotalea acetylenica TaxID=29542 RepID=A0A1L3GE47_SYNAC|nr:DUF6148 family protein [Syntrophotalea acetylenica]APG24095.1 hypothetical protein A7E75_02905 [Syntrophotalea acetylenica]APG44677.1 hypothetical protein A6070_11530 [Syntrophotalea acetylenica]